MKTETLGSGTSGAIPFVREMRERWRSSGQSPCVSEWSSRNLSASLAGSSCNHDVVAVVAVVAVMGDVRSALVHGYADQRGNLECKNHLQRIFKKLDVSNRAQAVSKMKQVLR